MKGLNCTEKRFRDTKSQISTFVDSKQSEYQQINDTQFLAEQRNTRVKGFCKEIYICMSRYFGVAEKKI